MTPATQTTPANLVMRIVAACVPDLAAGEYKVRVRQTVKRGGTEISKSELPPPSRDEPPRLQDEPTFEGTSTFWVSAPRFTLASSEIYARYPPPDALGHFYETLPHVVFRRRTLPWERRLAGDSGGPVRPWLALLVLDEDELGSKGSAPLSPRNVPVEQVVANRPSGFAAPDPWEPKNSPCQVLDLPWSLFDAIAPAWDDLPYLAHAREIATPEHIAVEDSKPADWTAPHMEADGVEDGGWFAVVVGNRLPAPGKEHHAFLVSLEGLEGQVQRASGKDNPVRLVVLASWRFTDDRKTGFRELITTLPCGAMRLDLSAPAPTNGRQPGADTGTLDPNLLGALYLGYVPLEHRTREGHHTVSWYRGPLAPHFLPTSPRNVVYPSADAALRYDPDQGLLDVSYAAAWQLGRLLGLQNRPFAGAVQRLKLAAVQQAVALARRQTLERRFGAELAGDWDRAVTSFLGKLPPPSAAAAPRADGSELDGAHEPAALEDAMERAVRDVELPVEIRQFLGRLFLLHGVPARYLVPHSRMLPPEALRIFYLDTSWVGALIDGALSIGRVSRSTVFLDKAMAGNFLADAFPDGLGNVDPDTLPKGTATFGDASKKGDASKREVVGHLTGFLLRSALVSGWRGMEIVASDAQGPLIPLRLQRIAGDTLLAIYAGQIKRLVIGQPPQGVHLGVNGAAGRTGPERLAMRQRAVDLALDGKPAEFAGRLLVSRVEHTIDVEIVHE